MDSFSGSSESGFSELPVPAEVVCLLLALESEEAFPLFFASGKVHSQPKVIQLVQGM